MADTASPTRLCLMDQRLLSGVAAPVPGGRGSAEPGDGARKQRRRRPLDWRAGTLGVTHGMKRIKNRDSASERRTQLVVSELKTPKSRRTLALTPEIVARLREHRARQAEARIVAGELWQEHRLAFTTEVGTPVDPDNFSHAFSQLCESSGLGH